jgi:hypothetical protein
MEQRTFNLLRSNFYNLNKHLIERNISGISGEHNLSPVNESLSPYLDKLSPVSKGLSPEETEDLSTRSNETGDSGDTGDKSSIV